jgi:hypothetical protein
MPPFNTALGDFLALPAHLEQQYSDVVTQIFPLKANIQKLHEFCDSYLNLDEDLPLQFKPAAPWVLMQVVDYGKMASSSKNVGWFSQHELAFGVPVRCYKKQKDKWVLDDWAMVFPFIYVDNPLSMSGGREIYGWSKSEIKIDAIPSVFEPANARNLVNISLVTSGTSCDETSVADDFLQIFQRRPFLSAKSAVSDVLTAIPRAITNSIAAAYGVFETGLFPYSYNDPDTQSLQEMISRFYGQLNPFTPAWFQPPQAKEPSSEESRDSAFNIVTLKQIRDVSNSSGACFQAVVGSRMRIQRTTDGGYLFDPLLGDTTGGIYINLRNSIVQPIAQTLGIESSEYSSVGGKPASTLRSLMPFWLRMDLSYGLADYQCWRTDTTTWTFGNKVQSVPRRELPYLRMGSGAGEEVGGPYHFPNITYRVLPLRADKNKLQTLVNNYLENDFFEFQITGQITEGAATHAVVCLVGVNFDKMNAASDPGAEYSDREMIFVVPVLWWEKGRARVKNPALVPLYTFTGADWNAATSYEVYGQFAFKSEFVNPDEPWLSPTGADPTEPILTLKTELFPELGKSQEAHELTVLEIFSASGRKSHIPVTTYLRKLGLEHFWTGQRYHSIALKQVMDAEDTACANYQALVGIGRQFTGRKRENPMSGILAPLSLNVYDYPTFPIVETLGLITEKCDDTGPYPKYSLKPIDPFWVSGTMDGDAGLEMCQRVGTKWQRNPSFDTNPSNVRAATGRKRTLPRKKK